MGKLTDGYEFFVVNWKKAVNTLATASHTILEESDIQQEEESGEVDESIDFLEEPDIQLEEESGEVDESIDFLEEPDVPHIRLQDGCCFLSTDEDILLFFITLFPEKPLNFSKKRN